MKVRFLLAVASLACAVSAANAFESCKEALQAAKKARDTRNYDEALKICEEAKSLASKTDEKHLIANLEASVYWQKKDFKKALAKLDEIIGMEGMNDSQKVFAMTQKANYLKWKGKRAEAETVYKEAMEIEVGGSARQVLLNHYAELLSMNRKFAEALELYKQSAAIKKGSFQPFLEAAKLGIANTTANIKDYDKALELYAEIIELPNISPRIKSAAYREMAEKIYLPQKKYEEYAEFIKKVEADKHVPKSQKSWIGTVSIRMNVEQVRDLLKAKEYDEAMEKAKETKKFQTNVPWVRIQRDGIASEVEINRADDLRNQKKFDEAIEVYNKVMEMEDTPPSRKHGALLGIAATLISQKKFDEAKEYIDKAMAFPKQNSAMQASALNTISSYYLSKHKVDEAIAALEKAPFSDKELNPGWKAALYSKLAEIYFFHKKDLRKADEYIKKSMAVSNAKWGKNKRLEEQIRKALEKQNQR